MGIQHYYSQTIADGTATSVVRPSDWNSSHKQILNISGNTLGTSQVTGSDIVWAGGNNVTLSANGSTVSIVGPNTVAQSVQTQASGNIAGTGFTSTTTAGVLIVGTNNTAGLSIGVPNYITTYVNDLTSGRAGTGFTSASTGGTNIVATVNTNGVSMGVPNYITTYAAQTTQTQPAGNIAGVGTTFGGTNVSGSMTLNSDGLALSLSAANPGGGAGDGYNIIGVNGGATQLSTTYQLSNANNVSFGLNAGTITASASYPTQTVQTQPSGNIAGAGFTSTTTAGTAVVATHNSNGLSMGVPAFLTTAQPVGAYLTTARASNDAIGLNSGLTANGVSMTANSSGLSLNFPAFLTTAAQSNHSHNFATTTTNGSQIVVGTTNSAGATVGVPPFITTYVAQTNQTQASGNIAGVGTTFAGANLSASMTMNSNGLNLSMSAAAPGGGGAINVSAGTTSGNLQTVQFDNANGVTFGLNGSTVTASVNAGGAGIARSHYPQYPVGLSSSSCVSGTSGAGSTTAAMYVNPLYLDQDLHAAEVELLMSHGALSAGTGSATVGWHLGFYTQNGASLSLVSSFSAAARISQNSATAQTIHTYWGSTSNANSSQTSGNISAAYMTAGLRDIKLYDSTPLTLSAGTYYLVHCLTMRSSSVNIANSLMTGMYNQGVTNHAYLGDSTLGPAAAARFVGSATSQITGAAGNTLSMSLPNAIETTRITQSASNAGRWIIPRMYN